MEKIFVGTDLNMIGGVIAEELFNQTNDIKYLVKNVGVPKVDIERWKIAQIYEEKTWCNSAASLMQTDRNEEHEKHFGGYSNLNKIKNF